MRNAEHSRCTRRWLVVALLTVTPTTTALAQSISAADLARTSLEELMKLRITSAERKEQRADDVPAAVHVITQDDIRRSGLTKLAEIFRLVPGLQVAQVNASEWAVAVRGFNSLYSDKLLVLIDGRSLYNRGFSGVFWDAQNLLASDIDRIEVVRGPGGSAWRANAVNGVINIITKSAADTKGTAVAASVGTFERDSVAARYGGAVRGVDYRVYSQWSDHNGGLTASRAPSNDRWNALTTGSWWRVRGCASPSTSTRQPAPACVSARSCSASPASSWTKNTVPDASAAHRCWSSKPAITLHVGRQPLSRRAPIQGLDGGCSRKDRFVELGRFNGCCVSVVRDQPPS